MSSEEITLREALSTNPGAPEFVSLAELLRAARRHFEALGVLVAGLSASPDNHKGRLLLARVFYELQAIPFAVRELKELCLALPGNKPLVILLEKLAPQSEVVAGGESSLNRRCSKRT